MSSFNLIQLLQNIYYLSATFNYTKMIYQLPNGKCVEMSIEQYLKMSDQELKNLVAYNYGEEFNDPFTFSVLRHGFLKPDEIEELEPDDFAEEELEDLTTILPDEKIFDEDFIDYDNLEQ